MKANPGWKMVGFFTRYEQFADVTKARAESFLSEMIDY